MKCKHAQRCMLSTSGPRKLSDEVLAHLDSCPACKAWQVRLQEIDRAVPLLPVPDSSDAKAAVIEQVLGEPATISMRKWWHRSKMWQRAVIGVAASALVILVGSRVFRSSTAKPEAPPGDAILAQLLDRNLTFARAGTAEKKVETLAALAQDLETETRNLARVANAEELNTLADLYADVIRKGLFEQALEVPPDDRVRVLVPIAERFFASSKSLDLFTKNVPPAAAPSLRKIAALAGEANQNLRDKTRLTGSGRGDKIALETPPPPREGQS